MLTPNMVRKALCDPLIPTPIKVWVCVTLALLAFIGVLTLIFLVWVFAQ